MIKGRTITIYAEMATGTSITSGESQISKDGGAFANTTNLPAELGTTGKYPLTLTTAETNADSLYIRITDAGSEVFGKEYFTSGEPSCTVVTDAGNGPLTFKTDLTETANDYWKDKLAMFVSGSLLFQVRRVASYDGSTKQITLNTAVTATPSSGDRLLLL